MSFSNGLGELGLGELGLGEMGLGEMGGHRIFIATQHSFIQKINVFWSFVINI